jgi:outer membrane protein assembly factor BamB
MLHSRPWLLLLVAFVLAGGFGCDEPSSVGGTRGDFRVEPRGLDFGRVLEGSTAHGSVTVSGTGRAEVTVSASVKGDAFSLPTSEVSVPGADSVSLEVLFSAGNGPAEGTLVLSAGGRSQEVALRGEGVRPLTCVPSAQCRQSHFELEPGVCVESEAPEGTACIAQSRCQENGRCQGGVCVGSPRSCDDGNPCTRDGCSPDEGCVTAPVACPVPTNPCHAGACDRERGCTEVAVSDLTVCGKVDCVTARLCLSGTCRDVPTPEGFLCAPSTPCQGEGHCSGGTCVRPDPVELEPAFSQELGGEPSSEPGGPVLLSRGEALFASVCGGDAGCRLVSYTGEGFLRYETPYPEDVVRALLAVSDAGVVLHEPEGLASYASSATGSFLWRVPLTSLESPPGAGVLVPTTGAGRVALSAGGEAVSLVSWAPPEVTDGGVADGDAGAALVVLAPDGGVLRSGAVEGFTAEARVALDSHGGVFLFAAGGPLVRAEPGDGGVGFRTVPLLAEVPGSGASLAVAGERLFAGARTFVDSDGGLPVAADWDAGTLGVRPLAEPVLLLDDTGYAFARTCARTDGTACTPEEEGLVLRAFDARGGTVRWETPVLPDEAPGVLHEAALLQGGAMLPGSAVGAVTSERLGGETRTHVQLFSEGQRLMMCPLRGTPRVAGAVWAGRFVYVALEREGTWRLEAFDLGGLVTAETRGWPQGSGVSGSRRARP